MMALRSPYLPIITLNVSGLNSPIERHRVDGWIKKTKTHVYAAYKRLNFSFINTYGFQSEGTEKVYRGSDTKRKPGRVLLSDKIDFKPKNNR